MPAETVLYQSGDITVTTSRIVAGPATFAIPSVASVRLGGPRFRFFGPGAMPFTLALCSGPLGLLLAIGQGIPGKFLGALLCLAAMGLGVYGLLLGAVGWWWPVLLRTADGAESPVFLRTRQEAEATVAAVSEALSRR